MPLCSPLPTKADVALMKSMPKAPDASSAPHVARWYKNIASYSPVEVYVFGAICEGCCAGLWQYRRGLLACVVALWGMALPI